MDWVKWLPAKINIAVVKTRESVVGGDKGNVVN
jgi:hypothetical protein